MNKTIALIAAACISTPALAWGDREQGALAGILGTLIYQNIQRDGFGRHPAPVVVQQQPQIIYAPAPQPQVIIQNQTVMCPEGLAPFYNQRFDRFGRPFYIFDGCR